MDNIFEIIFIRDNKMFAENALDFIKPCTNSVSGIYNTFGKNNIALVGLDFFSYS